MRHVILHSSAIKKVHHILGVIFLFVLIACTPVDETPKEMSISGITPSSGTISGGYTVTLSGSNLDFVETVDFGGVPCTDVVATGSTLSCTAPETVTPGSVVVAVRGKARRSASTTFTYTLAAGPTLTSFAPTTSSEAGGTSIFIFGTGFATGATIEIGGVPCNSSTVMSTTQIECEAPAMAAGTYTIVVTNTDGSTVSSSTQITYNAAPTITSITPVVGPIAGGTTLTITGTGFLTGATAYLNTLTCGSATVLTPTSMTCVTPATTTATTYTLRVVNPDGQTATLSNAFTYFSTPTITTISPTAGALAGGTTLTVNGTNFSTGATVFVGGVACTPLTYVSSSQVRCPTPGPAAGAQAVTINNPGTPSATYNSYTYQDAPTVASVSPTAGALAGNTLITITGTFFRSGATVLVGAAACTSITVVNATTITCRTPANSAGAYAITVTNTDTQSGTSVPGIYTYQAAPAITTVTPDYGPLAGGTAITITGTGFIAPVSNVTVGGVACVGIDDSGAPTTITCTTPAGSAGAQSVVVTNPDSQTATSSFTYLAAPTFTSVSPSAGQLAAGTILTITGTNFFTGASITIGGSPCVTSTVNSATSITCEAPAGAGASDIVITNVDGQTITATGAYTYQPAPAPASPVAPANGPASGGTAVVITGTDFYPSMTVTIGGTACPVTATTGTTSVTCTAPAKAAGAYDVVVTNTDNQTATLVGAYTYDPAPTVSSISPSSAASNTAGTVVTITGTNFISGATVTIGGLACTAPDYTGVPTSISCSTPSIAAGVYSIVVTNPDTQDGTLTNGITFFDPPTITSVTPAVGPAAGGNTITIAGTNFDTNTNITVDGLACTTKTFVSATSMTCLLPAHAAGAVAVVVTNPDGITATDSYTYQDPPVISSVSPTNGPLTGGTAITITGTGFLATPTVMIGSSACTGVVVTGTTQIDCSTPSATTAGAVTITVTNVSDSQSDTYSSFTYDPAPTITNFSPIIGPSAGGQTLTINGTNFVGVPVVTVDGVVCAPLTSSSTVITCTTPAGTAGARTVVVTNPDGQSVSRSPYTYLDPPTLTSISPVGGSPSGGTSVTITGTNFMSGTQVTFNGQLCTSPTITSTQITCTTPAGASGAATVVVTNVDNQSDSDATLFSYNFAPIVSAATPAYGPIGGRVAQNIQITGSGFISGATVRYGSNTANCTFVTTNRIDCDVPASIITGAVSITVTNPDTQSNTLANAFTYMNPPAITSISPSTSPATGGITTTITGSGFYSGATVTIDGANCTSVNVVSSTTITCIVPAHAVGPAVDVVVTNVDTQTTTSVGAFTYQAAPTVTGLDKVSGVVSGGTSLTITGTGFAAGATVSIGGANCTSLTVVSSVSITCTTTANSAGSYVVRVTNADGQYNTTGTSYTYRNLPVVANITPSSGTSAGSVAGTITVNGSGFVTGDVIRIGSTTCTTSTRNSSFVMTCTGIPAQAAGTYNVSVTTPDNNVSTLANAYSYRDPATVTSVSPNSGTPSGNTLITITGTNFLAGSTVNIGGTNCTSVTVVSSTSITCRTGAKVAGTYDVNVVGPNMPAATLTNGYQYVATPILGFHVGTISPTPPNPDDYGTTSTNVTHTFTLRNTGDAPTTAITVSLGGANPDGFMIGTNNCTTLAGGASCTVQVHFLGAFSASGSYTATLQATATSGGTVTNTIQGTIP